MPVCIFTRPHAKDVIHFDLSQVMNTVSFFHFRRGPPWKLDWAFLNLNHKWNPTGTISWPAWIFLAPRVSCGFLVECCCFLSVRRAVRWSPHLLPASHPAPTYCTAWMPACLLETGGKASKIRPLRSKLGTTAFSVRAHCMSWVIAYQCVKI